MANSRIMLTCKHCGEQFCIGKGYLGSYFTRNEEMFEQLNEFYDKHKMGECSDDIDCSDDAKNHFVILEEGDELSDDRLEKSAKTDAKPIEKSETEIMKALECCTKGVMGCINCPLFDYSDDADACKRYAMRNSLDLINRKNAEIERLEKTKSIGTTNWLTKGMSAEQIAEKKAKAIAECNAEIRAEAIKEFAERVKAVMSPSTDFNDYTNEFLKIVCNNIDQIAKEMGVEL